MDKRIESFLADKFQGVELENIKKFMNLDFSLNGQIAIASIFVFAQEHGKSVDEILAACQNEWKNNWNLQHPELRGDPDAPGKAGLNNRISLDNIY
jgi:hypothetical protein